MPPAAPEAIAATRAVEAVMRDHRGRLLAALIARLRDFQLAEDALQDAALSAISHWGRAGLPRSPQGWLLRVALRKAIDRLRSADRESRKALDQALLAHREADEIDIDAIPDDRLRLIFTCCHPALEEKTRIALTLRSLCGLTTPQVAAVFLDAEPTMGQRLSRAKAKIAAARIPFAVPGPEDWPQRLNSVLTTVYLIFTAGYAQGPATGTDLCDEAIFLARLLITLAPAQPEVEGCLALLLLTQARAGARISTDGLTLPPARQDRSLWNQAQLAEGRALLEAAVARLGPGPFQIKAAIAALHGEPTADWPQIALLYARLHDFEPTPVVRLNHAVALAEAGHPALALSRLAALQPELAAYQPFHAARAELLARTGQIDAAREAYDTAIRLAASAADRAFLQARRSALA
jgi:RNA polymerase sigma-70 factor (ECF subfamily)